MALAAQRFEATLDAMTIRLTSELAVPTMARVRPLVSGSPSGYLHRMGDAKRRMDPQYLARLFPQRSQSRLARFDEQRLEDASFSDLDAALIKRFAIPEAADELAVLARKLGRPRPRTVMTSVRRWPAFFSALGSRSDGCPTPTSSVAYHGPDGAGYGRMPVRRPQPAEGASGPLITAASPAARPGLMNRMISRIISSVAG